MSERHIIAIDMGADKISVCGASIVDDDITIDYFDCENTSTCITRSTIVNEGNAVKELRSAIEKAQSALGGTVSQIMTNLPKFPVFSREVTESSHLDSEQNITEADVADLRQFARDNFRPENEKEEELYGVSPLSFSTDDSIHLSESEVLGRCSENLSGDFMLFWGKRTPSKRIDTVANKLNVAAMRKYFTPLITGDVILEKQEKKSGVALVDFGASVTGVSIYLGGVLRYYGAVPFGGRSITGDISRECDIPWDLAENLKKAYGFCNPSKLQNLQDKMIMVNGSSASGCHQIYVKYLSRIIEARMKEIVNAVLYEIEKSGFADSLTSGLVITGGGANLCGCIAMFEDMSGYPARQGYPLGVCRFEKEAEQIRDMSESASVVAMVYAAAKDKACLNSISEDENVWDRLGRSGQIDPGIQSEVLKFDEEKEEEEKERIRREAASEEKRQQQEKRRKLNPKDFLNRLRSDGPSLFEDFMEGDGDDEKA